MTIQVDAKGRFNEAELRRFGTRTLKVIGLEGDVAILVTSNRRMREFNRWYRQKAHATDVLSFPGNPKLDHAGDIAISADIAAHNAKKLGHSQAVEIKVLILHGILHLAGYDHESDSGEMAGLEDHIRARLGLPNALIKRTLAGASRKKSDGWRKPAKIGRARAAATGRKKAPQGRSTSTK
ncbi:MAG TPA: rRNA maturation RNase YbeY [Terriglobales bacterium]|nr:rRNA maturation RNase YbeY [Terriglobales bacterium]